MASEIMLLNEKQDIIAIMPLPKAWGQKDVDAFIHKVSKLMKPKCKIIAL